jgi:phospholipase C
VLVSPLIAPGTVFRVPAGAMPLDHTSILKTVETRWNLPALTSRDAAANDVGEVLTLTQPRTDDPLQSVTVPVAAAKNPDENRPSHLQEVYAELAAQLPVPDVQGGTHQAMPRLVTGSDYDNYVRERVKEWQASRARK